jgi:hypothetical protein
VTAPRRHAGTVPAVLVVTLLVLAACGRTGQPVAPERVAPRPAINLSAVVLDPGIELAWTLPRHRANDARLRDLAVLHVFRSEDDGSGEPKPAMVSARTVSGYTPVAAIRMTDPSPATVAGDRMTFVDPTATASGRRYSYVVLAEDARKRLSPPSERLSVVRIAPPPVPDAIRATPGDREVRLEWRPGAGTGGDERRIVYQILRGAGEDAPLEVLTQSAPGATSLVDRGLDNERPYAYAVRALRTARGTVARSDMSARVSAMPVDTTPPKPPAELVAIPSQGAVRLAWIGSPDLDVTRYVVYRAREGGVLERVGSTAAPGTTFTDRDVPAGQWRYAVSAQDGSSRANESARSTEVTVTVP